MGRPQPSSRNKQLSLLFANSVTAPSSRGTPFPDTVGRTDARSLFDVFSRVCPSATRDQHCRGDGMSVAKFNKLLEADGFQRIRLRARVRKVVEREREDFNSYRFGGRRWRDPDNAEDMAAIATFWHCFSEFAACTLEEMTGILREALAAETILVAKRKSQCKAATCPKTRTRSGSHDCANNPSLQNKSRSSWDWADHERACASSTTSSQCSANDTEDRRSVRDDDEELQTKLAKEQYSTEGLPALYTSSALDCEPLVAEKWDAAKNTKLEPQVDSRVEHKQWKWACGPPALDLSRGSMGDSEWRVGSTRDIELRSGSKVALTLILPHS